MSEDIKREVVITEYNEKILLALLADGKAEELFLYDNENLEIGDIYIGKVKNIVDNIKAAFVEVSPGVMGYYSLTANTEHYYASDGHKGKLKVGDEILVQVERGPIKSKAAVLSSKMQFPGKYVVLMAREPNIGISKKITDSERRTELKIFAKEHLNVPEMGAIFRTESQSADESELLDEFERLLDNYNNVMSIYKQRTCYSKVFSLSTDFLKFVHASEIGNLRILTDLPDVYEMMSKEDRHVEHVYELYTDASYPLIKLKNLETQIGRALSKNVWLRSGASLVIEPTEALTVVDVNTSKTEIHKNSQETFYRINREAAVEIFRQIRLRNISGMILVDFINMHSNEYKEALMDGLRHLAKLDPVMTTIVDMTPLGLVEITRKRTYRPLFEQMRGK